MKKKIFILIKRGNKPLEEIIKLIHTAEVFKKMDLKVENADSFVLSQTKNSCILIFGKNKASQQFVNDKSFLGLPEEGYFIRSFKQESNDIVILGANRLRSLFYAAWDLIDTIQDKLLCEKNWFPINKEEHPAFPVRMRMQSLYFSDNFEKSFCGIIRKVFPLKNDPVKQREAAVDYILELFHQKFNTIIFASYGMDLIIDFEKIGFPEIYGQNKEVKNRRQRAILTYQEEVKKLIEIFHEFDIRVDIHHCGIIGFSSKFLWVEANFFRIHPETETKAGRDDPAINWHNGTNSYRKKFWCPSQKNTWKFVESYYREFFSQFNIEQFTILSGDCCGGLNCGCSQCKKFPYQERVKKLNRVLHRIMAAENPDCLLVHRNDDFINYYPGKEAEVENYVLEGLPNAVAAGKWAQPANFDFGTDWRVIYRHPLIGKVQNMYLISWYGWNAPVYNMWFGQYPQIYKEQFLYAASKGIKGVSLFHEAYDDSEWLSEPLFYDSKKCKLLEPYHFDVEAQIKCIWNPFSFNLENSWKDWCKKYFGKAGKYVFKSFQPSHYVLDILGRWDVGDYCSGGLPPFSYFDKIWNREGLARIAGEFYIRRESLENQSKYPLEIEFFDATSYTKEMITNLEKAVKINPEDKTLKRWLSYAHDTHRLAEVYKLYHYSYFLRREGAIKQSLRNLEDALNIFKNIKNLVNYGKTTFKACPSAQFLWDYNLKRLLSEIQNLRKDKKEPYDPGEHWQGGACCSGEKRNCYIYDDACVVGKLSLKRCQK